MSRIYMFRTKLVVVSLYLLEKMDSALRGKSPVLVEPITLFARRGSSIGPISRDQADTGRTKNARVVRDLYSNCQV